MPKEKNPIVHKSLVTFKVFSGSDEISNHIESIRIFREINKIPYAILEYQDGGVSESGKFFLADSGYFDPGKKISIEVGYDSKNAPLFKGIVTKQNLRFSAEGIPILHIECKDEAVKLTVGRKNMVYYEKKDSDILNDIIDAVGLSGDIESTDTTYPEIIQHYTTDWDFILVRADINGQIVYCDGDKVIIKKPTLSGEGELKVTYGSGLISFNGEIDARRQIKAVSAYSWSHEDQEIIDGAGKEDGEPSQSSFTGATLADVIGLEEFVLQSSTMMEQASLKTWANAKMTKSRTSKVRGSLTVNGTGVAVPDTLIKIEGLSDQFNGDAYIGGVVHVIEDGVWKTEIHMGLSDSWYSEMVKDIEAPSASGLIPGMEGLHIGIVKQIHEDPMGNYRVQVAIPILQQDNMPVWARLSNFYSTNESGVFFYPEVGDEVIIGFINNDPQNPVILGSVYNKKVPPMYTPDDKNSVKSIRTLGGLEIHFQDEDKILTIITPGENKIILDDKEKSITVEDTENKNKMVMDSAGILFEAEKDIVLKAKGKVTVESTDNTEIKATGDLKGEGMNVTLKGSTKFAAEGAQAELKGSATTKIEGGIVNIN